MKIIKILLLIVGVFIVLVAIAGMLLPSGFRMDRSTVMNADEKVIFEQINTIKNWEQWSPWQKMDPETKIVYQGPESGVGAGYSWNSTKNGEGTLVIAESIPYESLVTEMDFKENGNGIAGFKIMKVAEGNKVTWWFETDMGNNPFKKVFMNVMGKGFMTKAFDDGLAGIKSISEAAPASALPPAAADSTAY